jgi:hypothetical protein
MYSRELLLSIRNQSKENTSLKEKRDFYRATKAPSPKFNSVTWNKMEFGRGNDGLHVRGWPSLKSAAQSLERVDRI